MLPLRRRSGAWPAIALLTSTAAVVAGCASPGSPRPPSLHLPGPITSLSATRSGDEVEVQFALPGRSTDGQSLAGATLHGSLCREETLGGLCSPVNAKGTEATLRAPSSSAANNMILWRDTLSAALTAGAPRLIAYRITLRNAEGRSAGSSDAVYVGAGTAPPPVQHFAAEGSRPGVLLHWAAVSGPGQVLLERTQIDPKPQDRPARAAKPATDRRSRSITMGRPPRAAAEKRDPETVWMQTDPGGKDAGETIDRTIEEGVRYRYVAVRQITAKNGDRVLELRSAPSDAVEVTWRDVFPPPAPQGLTALGYATSDDHAGYAVDLVWQPVNDPEVTGYVVTRQALKPSGGPEGVSQRLSAAPVITPGFHDLAADPGKAYEYAVTAVDAKGNVSAAAKAKVSAQSR